MSILSALAIRLKRMLIISLLCIMGTTCSGTFNDSSSQYDMPEAILPSAELTFVSRRCESDNASVLQLTLPNLEITPILSDRRDNRQFTWSPDGQLIGVLSYSPTGRDLRVVDIETQEVRLELPGNFLQFTWSPDRKSIFILDDEGGGEDNLYRYDLTSQESEHITDGVSYFSVSPNGQWLGLSKRDPTFFNYFVFRVLDLDEDRLLEAIPDDSWNDGGCLGANHSVWSPIANEVAVICGLSASQKSKVIVYNVLENHLQVKSVAVARETYQRDYGEDLISVEFYDLAWSPDGQKLLVIRSKTDADTGGEVLLFDSALSDYQRLPFPGDTTRLVWTKDKWLVYVTGSNEETSSGSCAGPLRGEIWLADMETLESQLLITDTLFIEQPAWRP